MKLSSSTILKSALVLFVVLNVALIMKLKRTSGSGDDVLKVAEMKTEMLLNNIYFQEESEGAVMNGLLQIESEAGDSSCLAALTSGKPLLFLRYSSLNCNLCVDHSLSYLKSLADSIGHENIVILASYNTMRELALFKRVNQIRFPVYRIADNSLGIPADKYSFPYLFITNKSLTVTNLHIPDKDVPQLDKILLSVIPARFRELTK